MPRLVTKTAKGPVKVGDKDICMCGLSEKQPYCDCSHSKTDKEDPKKLYWYNDGVAEEVITEEEGCTGECSHGGCGHCQH